jgi:hypothetical protein
LLRIAYGGSLGTEGALQASGRAGSRQVNDASVSFVGASAPIRDRHDVYLRARHLLTLATSRRSTI